MQVTVTGKHLDITDSIRQYAQDKAGRLPRFYDRVNRVEVIASKHDSHAYHLEFIVHVDGHDHFIATGKGDDLYACIDETASKIERQLHEFKERVRNPKH